MISNEHKLNFSHFIITQFNLRNFPKSDFDDYDSWIVWTRNRIGLFREYCLPSVLNQSCKSFKWLIYLDSETPEEFKIFLNELDSYPGIEICYSRGIGDFNSNYIEEVKKRAASRPGWIITTRIDNDDCLHRDAVETIQKHFVERNNYLISLASGYILNISDRTLSHYFYPMSPFISLIEDTNEDVKGVFYKGHTRWDNLRLFIFKEIWFEYFYTKARRSRFILKKPMWIQTFHDKNVSNSFYRGFPVLKEKNLNDFSINFTTSRLPLKVIGRYYSYVTWKRYLKSLIIKIIIKK